MPDYYRKNFIDIRIIVKDETRISLVCAILYIFQAITIIPQHYTNIEWEIFVVKIFSPWLI